MPEISGSLRCLKITRSCLRVGSFGRRGLSCLAMGCAQGAALAIDPKVDEAYQPPLGY